MSALSAEDLDEWVNLDTAQQRPMKPRIERRASKIRALQADFKSAG